MNVVFTKEETNYTKENIEQIINSISFTDSLRGIYNNSNYKIMVMGDIHRSQFISENINNNFWFTIKIKTLNHTVVPLDTSIHIYVCFRLIDYNGNRLNCVNPLPYKNTDIADIRDLYGYWEYVGMTDSNKSKYVNVRKTGLKKIVRKPLKIIDPKTNKEINILAKGLKKTISKRKRKIKKHRNLKSKTNKKQLKGKRSKRSTRKSRRT